MSIIFVCARLRLLPRLRRMCYNEKQRLMRRKDDDKEDAQ